LFLLSALIFEQGGLMQISKFRKLKNKSATDEYFINKKARFEALN
jgi:hypothetical protein